MGIVGNMQSINDAKEINCRLIFFTFLIHIAKVVSFSLFTKSIDSRCMNIGCYCMK